MKNPAERRSAVVRLVEAEGVTRVTPPMLLAANQYFELAGEEFGRSLLMTLANDGVEYCLRPEFTIPIVSNYVGEGLAGSSIAAMACRSASTIRTRGSTAGPALRCRSVAPGARIDWPRSSSLGQCAAQA